MRKLVLASAAAGLMMAATPAMAAKVVAKINLSTQRMTVTLDGKPLYNWPVSTGRAGYHTPRGTYRPYLLKRMHYSRKYYNSPMPHSIFYRGGYAIHGTYATRLLGRPASHGCIRLHPSNAAKLFALVRAHGKANTRIIITGVTPRTHYRRAKHRRKPKARAVKRRYVAKRRQATKRSNFQNYFANRF